MQVLEAKKFDVQVKQLDLSIESLDKKKLPIIPKRFKFVRGVIWTFLALSVLFLGYSYYRGEIIFHGELGGKYFKYYVISLAGVLFWGGYYDCGVGAGRKRSCRC